MPLSVGDIVHIKADGTKHQARDFYLVVSLNADKRSAMLQKFCGNQLRSKQYELLLTEVYRASCSIKTQSMQRPDDEDDDSDEDDL